MWHLLTDTIFDFLIGTVGYYILVHIFQFNDDTLHPDSVRSYIVGGVFWLSIGAVGYSIFSLF